MLKEDNEINIKFLLTKNNNHNNNKKDNKIIKIEFYVLII